VPKIANTVDFMIHVSYKCPGSNYLNASECLVILTVHILFHTGKLDSGGPGSSVGIATDYGLDGPGIESRWGEIFRICPALGPTQPPVQWVLDLSRG
jgi:hypothetical protein